MATKRGITYRDSCKALYDDNDSNGDPTNQSQLDALTQRMADDYLALHGTIVSDICYLGCVKWQPSGIESYIEWVYLADDIYTRIAPRCLNDDLLDYFHSEGTRAQKDDEEGIEASCYGWKEDYYLTDNDPHDIDGWGGSGFPSDTNYFISTNTDVISYVQADGTITVKEPGKYFIIAECLITTLSQPGSQLAFADENCYSQYLLDNFPAVDERPEPPEVFEVPTRPTIDSGAEPGAFAACDYAETFGNLNRALSEDVIDYVDDAMDYLEAVRDQIYLARGKGGLAGMIPIENTCVFKIHASSGFYDVIGKASTYYTTHTGHTCSQQQWANISIHQFYQIGSDDVTFTLTAQTLGIDASFQQINWVVCKISD